MKLGKKKQSPIIKETYRSQEVTTKHYSSFAHLNVHSFIHSSTHSTNISTKIIKKWVLGHLGGSFVKRLPSAQVNGKA